MASGYNLRIGDADREAIAAQLREHFADGRLTLDELNERLDQTFAARTRADLNAAMRDLPQVARPLTDRPAWPAPAGRPGQHGQNQNGQNQNGWDRNGWDRNGWDQPGWNGSGRGGSGWYGESGAGHPRRSFFVAPMLALVWVAMVAGAVMLFGIGGDRPLAIVLILAAFAFLRRLIGWGRRGRGPRGPRGPRGRKGPRRGPRGPRF
jgi:hypothetical protein